VRLWRIAICLLPSFFAAAESYTGGQNTNPFANAQPSSAPAPPTRASDAGFFSNTGGIFDNAAGNSQNGLEYKFQDATRQSNAGVGAAVSAGTLLTRAGFEALAAWNFPEASRLFGLAGMEFAQAGASSRTAQGNSGNRSTLLANAGQSSQGFDPTQVADALLDPQTRQLLEKQGIDPSNFLNQLTSGSIRSGQDAAAALGKSNLDTASVNDYSGVNIAGIIGQGEPSGEDLRSVLGVAEENESASNESNPASILVQGGSRGLASLSQPDGVESGANSSTKKGLLRTGASELSHRDGKEDKSLSVGFQMTPKLGVEDSFEALSRGDLLSLGVSKSKQNIFGLAGRNYRSFSKWRGIARSRTLRR
jgi:hypothetical protein